MGTPAVALLIRRRAFLPVDLVDAIEAYLQGRFVATGVLNWVGAGLLPPGYEMPFASIGALNEEPDYQEDGSTTPPYDDEGSFTVMVGASTSSAAKSLRGQIEKSITNASLAFGDGTLLLIHRTSRGAPICEDESAPEGEQTWIAHLMFSTIVSRNLASRNL